MNKKKDYMANIMDYFLKNNPYSQISPNLIYTSNKKNNQMKYNVLSIKSPNSVY